VGPVKSRMSGRDGMTGHQPQPPNAEDIHKHLDLVQAVVTRMSAASSSAKSWLMPIVAATYGYAITSRRPVIALLGVGAVLLFLYLDANYLRQEKRYRRLYKAVSAGGPLSRFSLDPDEAPVFSQRPGEEWGAKMPPWIAKYLPGPGVWLSWSILPFYTVLLLVGGVVFWTFR
jgi:hypothetical protein